MLIWCINSLKGETHRNTHVFNDQFGGFISEKQLEPQAFCGWMSFCLVSGILFFCNKWIVCMTVKASSCYSGFRCLFASGCCYETYQGRHTFCPLKLNCHETFSTPVEPWLWNGWYLKLYWKGNDLEIMFHLPRSK